MVPLCNRAFASLFVQHCPTEAAQILLDAAAAVASDRDAERKQVHAARLVRHSFTNRRTDTVLI